MTLEQNRDIMLGMLKVGENGSQILSILDQITSNIEPAVESSTHEYLTEEMVDSL